MRVVSLAHLAGAVRGRRMELGLTQAELAERAGVSRFWVNRFEARKQTAEIGLVLRVLDALGLEVDLRPRDDPGTGASVEGGLVDLDEFLAGFDTP